ncbi:MAG: hypothetical protein C4539_14560 [Ignavibacteriales bacterium]|nr:MAG: hypothetical protein C4539_14560 [Ignavibacteriales bacterium]
MNKYLVYGIVVLIFLAGTHYLTYRLGVQSVKIPQTDTSHVNIGKPDTTVKPVSNVHHVKPKIKPASQVVNNIDSCIQKKIALDTTINTPEYKLRILSEDVVSKGLEIFATVYEKIITRIDTLFLTKEIFPLPEPFYDTFTFGYIVGVLSTTGIYFLLTKVILKD